MSYVVCGVMFFIIGFSISYYLFNPVHTALMKLKQEFTDLHNEIKKCHEKS